MSDETANLKLPNPQVGNVNWAGDWYDMTAKLDKHPGVLVTTSDDMPNEPWIGQLVYVEDLRELQSFDGQEWVISTGDGSGVELVTSDNMPDDPYHGQVVYVLDLDHLQTFNGEEWITVGSGGSSFVIAEQSNDIDNPVEGMLAAFTITKTLEIYFWDEWLTVKEFEIPIRSETNFSEFVEGLYPDRFESQWAEPRIAEIRPYSEYDGPNLFQIYVDNQVGVCEVIKDEGDIADIELHAVVRISGTTSEDKEYRVYSHVSGAEGSEDAYFGAIHYSNGEFLIGKIDNGETTILATFNQNTGRNVNFNIRYEISGNRIRLKCWRTSNDEPGQYQLSFDLDEKKAPGKFGLGGRGGSSDNTNFDFFSWVY